MARHERQDHARQRTQQPENKRRCSIVDKDDAARKEDHESAYHPEHDEFNGDTRKGQQMGDGGEGVLGCRQVHHRADSTDNHQHKGHDGNEKRD